MEWDFESTNKQSKKALKELKLAFEITHGKPCKTKSVGCSTCTAWAIYELVKLRLY